MEDIKATDWAILRGMAAEFFPWADPDEVLTDIEALAIGVMSSARGQDTIFHLRRILGDDYLREVMLNAPSVLFWPTTWGPWRYRLGIPWKPQSRRMKGYDDIVNRVRPDEN